MEDTIKLAFNIGQAIAKGKGLLQKSLTKTPKTFGEIAKAPLSSLTTKQKLLGGGLGAGAGLATAYGATELLENAGLREALGNALRPVTRQNLVEGTEAYRKSLEGAQKFMDARSLENITAGGAQRLGSLKEYLNKVKPVQESIASLPEFMRGVVEPYRPAAEELGYLNAKALMHKASKGATAISSLIPILGTAGAVTGDLANLAGQIDLTKNIAMGKYPKLEGAYLDAIKNRILGTDAQYFKGLGSKLTQGVEGAEGTSKALKDILAAAKNPESRSEAFAAYRKFLPGTNFNPTALPKEDIERALSRLTGIKDTAAGTAKSLAAGMGLTTDKLQKLRSLANESGMFPYVGLPPNLKTEIIQDLQQAGGDTLTADVAERVISKAMTEHLGEEQSKKLMQKLFGRAAAEAGEAGARDIVGKILGVILDSKDMYDTKDLISALDKLNRPPALDKVIEDYGLAYNKDTLEAIGKTLKNRHSEVFEAARRGDQERVRQIVDSYPINQF